MGTHQTFGDTPVDFEETLNQLDNLITSGGTNQTAGAGNEDILKQIESFITNQQQSQGQFYDAFGNQYPTQAAASAADAGNNAAGITDQSLAAQAGGAGQNLNGFNGVTGGAGGGTNAGGANSILGNLAKLLGGGSAAGGLGAAGGATGLAGFLQALTGESGGGTQGTNGAQGGITPLGALIGAIGNNSASNNYAAAIKQAAAAADPFASQRPAFQGQFQQDVNAFPGQIQHAADTADPFGQFRQGNQTLFNDLTSGKTNLNNTPWMQNLTNTAVDQSAQRLSSKYGGDVNSLGVRNTIANNVNAQNAPIAMSYLNTLLSGGTNTSGNASTAGNILNQGNTSLLTGLGNAAGANINPNSGQILATGAAQNLQNSNQLVGTIGAGANSLLQPNSLNTLTSLFGGNSNGGGSNVNSNRDPLTGAVI
jgi:hypothetical protein